MPEISAKDISDMQSVGLGCGTNVNDRKKIRTPLKQRVCYGVGHILNDLSAFAGFSYMLVFLTKIVGVSNSGAGYIILVAQVSDGLLSPIIGYSCDRFNIPYFSRRLGKRKGWHMFGTIFMCFSNLFLFMRCFFCEMSDSQGQEWPLMIFYSSVVITLHVGFAAVQISHLSLLSDISKSSSETVELNALRSGLTFASGIFVYGVTWVLLGESREEHLSHDQWKEFMILGFIIVGVGSFFSAIFHFGTVEPSLQAEVVQNEGHKEDQLGTDVSAVQLEQEVGTQTISPRETTAAEILQETDTSKRTLRQESSVEDHGIDCISSDTFLEPEVNTDSSQTESISDSDSYFKTRNNVRDIGKAAACSETKPELDRSIHRDCDGFSGCGSSDDTAKENEGFDDSDYYSLPNEIISVSSNECAVSGEAGSLTQERLVDTTRSWKGRFRQSMFYKLALVYMCTRVVVNVSNSYFALYLVETLRFQKEAVAYFPLVVLVSGVISSAAVKRLNKWLGRQITYCIASLMVTAACAWYYVQTVSGRNAVYVMSILMGSGSSIMLVTVLAMTVEFIGEDKSSGAFVYGSFSFVDKVANGALIAVIQRFYPSGGKDCPQCGDYIRHAYAFSPGSAALLGLLIVAFCFPSRRLVCRFAVQTSDVHTQTVGQLNLSAEHSDQTPNLVTKLSNQTHTSEVNGSLSSDRTPTSEIVETKL